jgi:hypothetical protein
VLLASLTFAAVADAQPAKKAKSQDGATPIVAADTILISGTATITLDLKERCCCRRCTRCHPGRHH